MKFKDLVYKRPDIEKIQQTFAQYIDAFKSGKSFEEESEVFNHVNELRKEFDSMANLVYIRYTINTKDPFYVEEKDFFDQVSPLIEDSFNEFLDVFLSSSYLEEHEKVLGTNCIFKFQLMRKVFSKEILEELMEENRLSSRYSSLLGSLEVEFKGKVYPFTAFSPFLQNKDRQIREDAHKAMYKVFKEKQPEIDEIYDGLVKLRHQMAKKLGYENFVQMGYDRMGRTDYGPEEVYKYRKAIYEVVVPVAQRLVERKRKRLGLDHLYYYDLPMDFLTGNPTPKGDPEHLVKQAQKMYEDMSPYTGEFFAKMVEDEMMDLEAKKGKAPGGYCTFIESIKMPFIFSNFNGTSGDVDVLTHEFGHAFQCYRSKDVEPLDLRFPGYEGAEIHSMSMEMLAYPYMELFFQEDTQKYYYSHGESNLMFLPYGATIDEYQHWVYENPQATPEQRNAQYREIEKKYMPWKDYKDNDYLEKGGFWHKQGHLFGSPFYYIDYTLALNVALQIYGRFLKDPKKAFEDYLKLCDLGGSRSFVHLVESVGLKPPFEKQVLEEALLPVENLLEEIDDQAL